MTRHPIAVTLVYVLALVLGGIVAWRAAPDIEAALFPPFADERFVAFDLARPGVMAERQLDRICWRVHVHKLREVRAQRRSITFIAADGTRYFVGGPIDGRTGEVYSSKDAIPAGYRGDFSICAYLPNNFDATQAFDIESFGQYLPPHGMWALDHTWPTLHVPATLGADR